MFDWINGFFKKPENKLVLVRKGPLGDKEIELEIKKTVEEANRANKEWVRNKIKEEEGNRCFSRTEERNHYLNEAQIIRSSLFIMCAFCGERVCRYFPSSENTHWLEDVLREEGFE